jgi:hypothetical protein
MIAARPEGAPALRLDATPPATPTTTPQGGASAQALASSSKGKPGTDEDRKSDGKAAADLPTAASGPVVR